MNLKPSEYAFLRSQENAEWNANGLGAKENIKRKIEMLKQAVKSRQDISAEDYAKLIGNRKVRLQRIEALRPVFLSRPRLFRLGVDDEGYREIFEPLRKDRDANDLLDQALDFLKVLDEFIFDKGLTRQEFRKHIKKAEGSAGVKVFDVSEFGLDWIIWRMEAYLELLANLVGLNLEELTVSQAKAITRLSSLDTVRFRPAPNGASLPHWFLDAQKLAEFRSALPTLHSRLHLAA